MTRQLAYLHHHAVLFHQATGNQPAFFRLALFVNQLKRIRRNLERIKMPRGNIPRVSPVVVVVVVVVLVIVVPAVIVIGKYI